MRSKLGLVVAAFIVVTSFGFHAPMSAAQGDLVRASNQTNTTPSTRPHKPTRVAVCVESRSLILRWALNNSCARSGEFKLSWSAADQAPALCVNTISRAMMLADGSRCRPGSTKLARLTPGKRAVACVDATTGILKRPRTGRCLVQNLAVKWTVTATERRQPQRPRSRS